MKKEEIRECQFIDEALKFYTYEDFYKDKKTIKAMYRTLDNKIFYKWFVYEFSPKGCNLGILKWR